MLHSKKEREQLTNELIAKIDKEVSARSFMWAMVVYDHVKRDFLTSDIFEPLSEDEFDEYASDEDRHDDIVNKFEAAVDDLRGEIQKQEQFIQEIADSSRVTFNWSAARQFYNDNMEECDEVAEAYELDPNDDDDVFEINYQVQKNRVENELDKLADFFFMLESSEYL